MPLASGEQLGHYKIQSLIGKGGMGEVFRALDTKLDREVAIKVLPGGLAGDPERLSRFEREAKVLAQLNHPGIAAIHGVEDRALVMELVPGPTLADRIKQGPIPPGEAEEILLQIADALEYAHERGVIHRDLKPANIKIDPDDKVKILDFGLAKALVDPGSSIAGDPTNSPTVTITVGGTVAGTILGTAAYMAPEQARGKKVDRRADIWAFGVVAWEMLTGERLFQGEDTVQVLSRVLEQPVDLERASARFRKMLGRCLDRNPKERLRDIGEARFLIGEPASASVAVPPPAKAQWLPWAIAALLAIAAGVALWAPWRSERPAGAPAHLTLDLTPATILGPPRDATRPAFTAIALSPDGNTIIFSGGVFSGSDTSAPSAKVQLYKRSLDQAAASPIPGTENGYAPFFSPDGQWLGFFAGPGPLGANSKLKKVPLNGGPPLTLCDAPPDIPAWGGTWNSAGTIVFAARARGLLQVPEAGGTPQPVLKLDPAKPESYSTPWFLPDNKTLLFTARDSDNWDDARIVARRLDTGEQHDVIKGGADARYVNTGHLLYVKNAVLMAVPFDAGKAQLAGQPVAMLDGVMQSVNMSNGGWETGMAQFAISAAGHLVYASGGITPGRVTTLVRADRKGVESPLNTAKGFNGSPRLSPDGQKIAVFRGSDTSRSSDIYVIDVNTGNATRLTSQGSNSWPIWSPDGKRVLFRGGTGSQMLAVAADGSGSVEAVFTGKGAVIPASVTEKLLVYLEFNEGKFEIWTRPLSGPGEPQRFAESKSNQRWAELSPDGRWMAYSSDESGQDELYVQAFPAGEKHRISPDGGLMAAWARNGREFFYVRGVRQAPTKRSLMAVDFTLGPVFKAGTPHELFEFTWAGSTPLRDYDVTPDGRSFIGVRPGEQPDQRVTKLDIVLNWTDELKKRAPRTK